MSTIILLQIMPYIRDIVPLANVSRSRSTLQIRTEYFIDQEKYFYLIIFHANAAFIIGVTAILATGTLIIVSFQYACGMFKVARWEKFHIIINEISFINSDPFDKTANVSPYVCLKL